MIYATPGSPFDLTIEGAPLGAVGQVGVRIIDLTGNEIVPWQTTGIVELGGGEYRATLAAPLGSGIYRVQARSGPDAVVYGGDDLTVNPVPVGIAPAAGYPAADALIAGLSGDARAALDALDGEQQEAVRLASIVGIEEFCGQPFGEATVETRAVDGSGGSVLLLDRHLDRLDSIEIYGTSFDASAVVLSDAGDALTIVEPSRDNGYMRLMGSLDPDYDPSRRVFTWGRHTVTVAGAWGWLTVPPAVIAALRIDMAASALADSNALSSTVAAFRRMGLRDVRQGNLSVTLAAASTLPPDAQRLLTPLVWTERGELA